MNVIIQSPDFKAQEHLLDFANRHVDGLSSYSDRIQDARVCLTIDASSTDENKVCDIRLSIPGNDLFASKRSKSFEDSILQAVSALRHQLARWKDANTSS